MTTADVEVLNEKVDALKESVDKWQNTNCASHGRRIEKVEDELVNVRLEMARGTKFTVAASFFGSLLPSLGILFVVLKHFAAK